jgi:transposase-like protein
MEMTNLRIVNLILTASKAFGEIAKMRIAKFRGLSKNTFYLHLKESEFRFNYQSDNLYNLILKIVKEHPLN